MWFLWEVLVNAIVISFESYLFFKQLGIIAKKRKYVFVGTAIIVASISLLNYLDIGMAFVIAPGFTLYTTRLAFTGLFIIYAFLVFKGNSSEKIMWAFVPMFLTSIADLVSLTTVAILSGTDIATVTQYGPSRFWVTLLHIGIVVITCLLLANARGKKSGSKLFIPVPVRVMLIIILLVGTIAIDILIDNLLLYAENSTPLLNVGELLISIAFILIICFTFLLVTRVGVLSSENMEYAIEIQQSKWEEKDFKNMELAIEELRETKHDIIQHRQTMRGLLANKDYSELERYYESSDSELSAITDVVLSKNPTLNGLLFVKSLNMKADNILFHHQLYDTDDIPIKPYDLCSILGNLLDNAIEACKKIENLDKRFIQLQIKRQKDMLIINVENSFNGEYKLNEDHKFLTIKSGEGHGFGLRRVERVANKCRGHIQIQPEKALFRVTVFLPCVVRT